MITVAEISNVFKRAQIKGILNQDEKSFVFYDLDMLKNKLETAKNLFPDDTLHAVAVKTNPVKNIMSFISSAGMGFEAASLPEVYMALNSGVSPENIVFDSPSKTVEELIFALDLGIYINADSIMELERIDQLLKTKKTNSSFGIRINPQVGLSSYNLLSTSGALSKFGVPLDDMKDILADCFEKYNWLSGVHVHVGSQGCDLDLIIKGVKKVFDFSCLVNELQKKRGRQNTINTFDIGGGLSVQYSPNQPVASMDDYAEKLRTEMPELFNGEYKIITEFGRYFHGNCAWAVSKVEYVKRFEERNIAVIHLGADMFLRKCYNSKDEHHEISVLDKYGAVKNGRDCRTYDIAGPLCFAGDIIARDLEMPEIVEGDYIVMHDVGANTFSMWSRHLSRPMPEIMGYIDNNFEILKKRESISDVLRFWE